MPRLVKNAGYTTPTKEEMRAAIEDTQAKARDYAINGKDYEIDTKKKVDEMNQQITEAFTIYIDNLREVLKFMDEFSLDHAFDFTVDPKDKIVRYKFGFYEIHGNSIEENAEELFKQHSAFMLANGIKKSDIVLDADLSFLTKPIFNSNPNAQKLSVYQFAAYTKAKRIQEMYKNLADNRYFIPEFIIRLPKQYLTDYFFMHLVNNDLCDGLFSSNTVPAEVHERLGLPYYPVIFIDPIQGQTNRDQVKSSLKFLNEHNEYFV